MFAAAAVSASMHAAHDSPLPRRTLLERALADLLADPGPLRHGPEEREPVWLLFVSLGSLQLAPNLANARFQVRIRYGGNGRFREKHSQKVKSTPPVDCQGQPGSLQGMLVEMRDLESAAELNGILGVCESYDQAGGRWLVRLMDGEQKAVQPRNLLPACQVFANMDSLFVFPWSRDLTPHITFSLRKLGFYDTTISEATVHIPFVEGRPGMAEQELRFLGKRGSSGFIGQLGISAELRCFARSDLLQGSAFPGALEEMLGSLELLRMPPGHLGPNSMAGRPAAGTPLEQQGPYVDLGMPAGFHAAGPMGPLAGPMGPIPMSPGSMHLHGFFSGFAGGAGEGTPVVMGRPVPGQGWAMR